MKQHFLPINVCQTVALKSTQKHSIYPSCVSSEGMKVVAKAHMFWSLCLLHGYTDTSSLPSPAQRPLQLPAPISRALENCQKAAAQIKCGGNPSKLKTPVSYMILSKTYIITSSMELGGC